MAIIGAAMVIAAIVVNQVHRRVIAPGPLAPGSDVDPVIRLYLNLGLAILVAVVAILGGLLCLAGILLHWRRAARERSGDEPSS